ncbi:MAG: hypothetical protein U0Y10_22320 [Spirosomataceae bacterium]
MILLKKLLLFCILITPLWSWGQIATPNYQAKLDEALKPLATIVLPELKADSSYQAKGNLKRNYWLAEAGQQIPYRLYVPSSYQAGKTPLIVLLHGGGGNENTLMDRGNSIALKLAEKHGYIVLSPLGYMPIGAYGTPLRLPAVYGKPEEQAKQKAVFAKDTARQKILALSEKDVMNVLALVRKEYQPDPNNIFLAGHSMGSGGTWYLGAKYWQIWKALAPMSGPFIDEATYQFVSIKSKPIFMSEGTLADPSLESSRLLAKYLEKENFILTYKEIEANHSDMSSLILPDVFAFFDKQLQK